MASMAMTAASFLPITAKHPSAGSSVSRRSGLIVVAKASTSGTAVNDGAKTNLEMKNLKEKSNQGRRELVAAAVTVAAATFARVAMADEPKPGTPEAKQKYASICVTMPTARICRK